MSAARRASWLALVAGAGIALTAARGAQEPAGEGSWRVERLDRELVLAPGAEVAIENRHGDLRIRGGPPGSVRVHAVLQRDAADPRRFELAVAPEKGRLRLTVIEAGMGARPPAEWQRRRADLTVEVPTAGPLAVVTEGGFLEVRGHEGALTARTAGGDIRLRVSGPVDARSERGSIAAVLGTLAWSHAARFEAPSGDIEIQFPPRADAEVSLETPGNLTTDYSLTVERVGPLRKRAHARLGRGGAAVALSSGRGDLAILQQPPAPTPAPGD